MSERSYLDFLDDILESIRVIEDYVEGMTYEEFKEDRRTVDAVVRNFEVIGEAASNLPEELKDRHETVEWRGVVNFRNVLVHDYFRVDTGRVWDTIERNLPELRERIERVRETERE